MIRFAYGDTRVSLRNPFVQYAHPSLLGKSHPPVLHICINLPRSLRIESPVDAVRRYYTYPYTNYPLPYQRQGRDIATYTSFFSFLPIFPNRTFFLLFHRNVLYVYACVRVFYTQRLQIWKEEGLEQKRGVFCKNKKRDAWSTRCNIDYFRQRYCVIITVVSQKKKNNNVDKNNVRYFRKLSYYM